jgi:hypothetical protein
MRLMTVEWCVAYGFVDDNGKPRQLRDKFGLIRIDSSGGPAMAELWSAKTGSGDSWRLR